MNLNVFECGKALTSPGCESNTRVWPAHRDHVWFRGFICDVLLVESQTAILWRLQHVLPSKGGCFILEHGLWNFEGLSASQSDSSSDLYAEWKPSNLVSHGLEKGFRFLIPALVNLVTLSLHAVIQWTLCLQAGQFLISWECAGHGGERPLVWSRLHHPPPPLIWGSDVIGRKAERMCRPSALSEDAYVQCHCQIVRHCPAPRCLSCTQTRTARGSRFFQERKEFTQV